MSKEFFLTTLIVLLLLSGCSNEADEAPSIESESIDNWIHSAPPSDNYLVARFRVWVPENVTNVKAVLVLLGGFNTDGTQYLDFEEWRTYAEVEGLALCGVHFESDYNGPYYGVATEGSGAILEEALSLIGARNNVPEIGTLPLLMRGYSAGGIFSYYFSVFNTERVAGFVNIRGRSLQQTSSVNSEVPGIIFVGEKENIERQEYLKNIVLQKRAEGGLWSYAVEPDANHFTETKKPDELTRTFFSSILSKRINSNTNELNVINETSGWLGNSIGTGVVPYEDYGGDSAAFFWLPDENVAQAWLEFHK